MPNAKKMAEKAKQENRSGGRLRAVRMFTDRDDLRTAYHRLAERAVAEDFDDCYVINYYGVGGVGKSTLLEKLRSEVEERAKNDGRKHGHICLMLDFDKVEADVVAALEHLKAQLQEQGFSFPLFELALYALYQKSGQVLDKKEREDLFAKNPLLDAVLDVSQVLPVVGMAASLGKSVVKLAGSVRDAVQGALDNHKLSLDQIEQMDRNALLKNLPRLFAEDANETLGKNGAVLHIFIDTYEKLVSVAEGQRRDRSVIGYDAWLYGRGGLIRELGNTVFAIAGREKLHWPEASKFWKDKLESHLTDHLSQEDSSDFLKSCGVRQELWHPLYDLTGGEPVFLDLCVDRYEELADEGKTPEPADFGRNVEMLVERHTRYLSAHLLDAVYLMAGMRRWDRETFDLAARSAGITVNPSEYSETLTRLSYVTDEGNDMFSMHQVIAGILASKLPDEPAAKASRALAGYAKEQMEPGCDPAAADLALRAAVDLAGERARTTELASALEKQSTAAYRKLHYSQAVENRRRAVDIYRDLLGPEHPDTLLALHCLAIDYGRLGDYGRAREVAEHEYETKSRLLGPEHPDTLSALHNLVIFCDDLGDYGRARELAEQVYEAQSRQLGPEHPDTLLALGGLAREYNRLGDYGRARELAEQEYEAQSRLLGPEHPDTLRTLNDLALHCGDLGDYGRARELAEQVYETQSRLLGPEHPETLLALGNLAVDYKCLGDYDRARELAERVYEARSRVLGPEHPNTLSALGNLALDYSALGDHGRARELAERAYEAQSRTLGPEHPDTLLMLGNLAREYSCLGDYGRARELAEQVYEARSRVLGPEHPDTLVALKNLAIYCDDLGDYGRARELAERKYEAQSRTLGSEHPDTLQTLHDLAVYCVCLDDYGRARELAERAYEARSRTLGPEHPDTLQTLHDLALDYGCLDDYGRARELAEQLYEARSRTLGPEHPETLQALHELALYCAGLDDYGRARDLAEKAYEAQSRTLGPEHPDTLQTLHALAACYEAAGDKERAQETQKKLEELCGGPEGPDKV